MKSLTSIVAVLFLMMTSTALCIAAELSSDSLEGKWMFTHILMEGSKEMKVNRQMEFLSDGMIVNYDAAGNEESRATYEITGDWIIYIDGNGKQKWKVVSFKENALHVDHRGAEMFFERQ
jgi:hypothetical protein